MFRSINGSGTFTAANTPATGTDVSDLTGDWSVQVVVSELRPTTGSGPKTATLCVQYVAAADFSTPKYGPIVQMRTDVQPGAPVVHSFRRHDFPALPMGVASGKLRLCVLDLDANAYISCEARVQN
jgi:hypothetical protein